MTRGDSGAMPRCDSPLRCGWQRDRGARPPTGAMRSGHGRYASVLFRVLFLLFRLGSLLPAA
jgi:hypothetical protein